MKKSFIPPLVVATILTLLAGCAWQMGGDKKYDRVEPTTGQQLIDLQKARDAGAITPAEYEAQKAKVLGKQ